MRLNLATAIFLDRDGVLIEDAGGLMDSDGIRILPGVPQALTMLKRAGYCLIVISNQAVVARGLLSEAQVIALHQEVEDRLHREGAPNLDGFYFCPHHPNATLPAYRQECECRKPRPGLILQAAQAHQIDLNGSFMIGDRPSDLLAGNRAGCGVIWVQSGQHTAAPIQTGEAMPAQISVHFTCSSLIEAARWILEEK
jgi:D-glycero-D-manno-heptose 1,7-bisphosphate phosphatase